MQKVTYFHEVTLDDVKEGQTLLDVSIRHRIAHLHQCGGRARCTTCRVQILDGLANVSAPNSVGQKVPSQRGWDDFTRLACQTRVHGDVVIRRLLDNAQDIIVLDLDELQGGAAGEGKEIELAILFCDIREFTTHSEQNLPYDVVHMLNRYFTVAAEPVLHNNGFIDKYIGDGILAAFGIRGESPGCVSKRSSRRARNVGGSTTARTHVRTRVQRTASHRHRNSLWHGHPRTHWPSGKTAIHRDRRHGQYGKPGGKHDQTTGCGPLAERQCCYPDSQCTGTRPSRRGFPQRQNHRHIRVSLPWLCGA